jgi:hypothetical protein
VTVGLERALGTGQAGASGRAAGLERAVDFVMYVSHRARRRRRGIRTGCLRTSSPERVVSVPKTIECWKNLCLA